jgi:DNA-binding Xre family transcriptional regulator
MDVLDNKKTYFEEHAVEMLNAVGMSKADFAKAVGVAPQNLAKLFSTKNALTLAKVSTVLNVSLHRLVYGIESSNKDIHGCIYVDGSPMLINSRNDLEELISILQG